ncbi:MAG: hypothetical protein IPN13_07985 [Bacteroidetes bacterium]|nr:hypothetical protein [Bacteroidota bacterium]
MTAARIAEVEPAVTPEYFHDTGIAQALGLRRATLHTQQPSRGRETSVSKQGAQIRAVVFVPAIQRNGMAITPRSTKRICARSRAETTGYDDVWLTNHHFCDDGHALDDPAAGGG